jgi:undecaprenyl-diphosphatase
VAEARAPVLGSALTPLALAGGLSAITVLVGTGAATSWIDDPVRQKVAPPDSPGVRSLLHGVIGAADTEVLAALVGIAALGCLLLRRPPLRIAVLLLGSASGAAVVTAIKRAVDRTGSYDLNAREGPGGHAYPSGHVTSTVIVTGLVVWAGSSAVSAERRRLRAVVAALALAGLEGLSLLVLRQHWLTDIVAGWLLGLLWLLLCTTNPTSWLRRGRTGGPP